uniref:Uncharacterized protein n=1 Tax=Arundo donax TaxID=35708 RepID=A0A0A9BAC7_ARUDO
MLIIYKHNNLPCLNHGFLSAFYLTIFDLAVL